MYLCLFATQGYDLRALLRGGVSEADLAAAIAAIWQPRSERYSELRASLAAQARSADAKSGQRIEMSYIGG